MQAWQNYLTLLEQDIGKDTTQKWLRTLRVIKFDACNLYLEAKDSFQALWFEEHIRKKVQASFVNNNGKKIRVHLNIANAASPTKPRAKTAKKPEKVVAPAFTLNFDELDPHATFDNYVTTDANLLAYRVLTQTAGFNPDAKEFVTTPELCAFNPIFLCGSGSRGKTHLLMATAHQLIKNGLKVIYARAETFTEHVVTAIRAGEMSIFRQAYRNADVLILDDIHVFSKKGATQEELFHTFNTLHMSGKQIILSANSLPSELEFIEPRLISRFEWGIVLPLGEYHPEETRAILFKKAEALRFPLPNKVADFLLETFVNSQKSLNRALEALVLRCHLQQREGKFSSSQLTAAMARYHLQDLINEEEKSAITPAKIVQIVAEHYGITQQDILGKAQSRDCVMPRHIAIFLCRQEIKMPFTKIGQFFSRDHSTVMSSYKIVKSALESIDNDISGHFQVILKKIKTSA